MQYAKLYATLGSTLIRYQIHPKKSCFPAFLVIFSSGCQVDKPTASLVATSRITLQYLWPLLLVISVKHTALYCCILLGIKLPLLLLLLYAHKRNKSYRLILVKQFVKLTNGEKAPFSPVKGEFPAQRPVTRGFDAFFNLHLNERLDKQSWCWWYETPSHPLWRRCNFKIDGQ